MTRYKIYQPNRNQPRPQSIPYPWPENQPETWQAHPTDRLSDKIGAALAAGIALGVLTIAIASIILIPLLPDKLAAALTAGGLGLTACIVTAAALIFSWSQQVATRHWRIDDAERTRAWQLQDEDRQLRLEAMRQLSQDKPPDHEQQAQDFNLLAYTILSRTYDGLPVTRRAMCAENLCTQEEWNNANHALTVMGLKDGSKLTLPDTLDQAWAHWQKHIYTSERGITISSTTDAAGGHAITIPW